MLWREWSQQGLKGMLDTFTRLKNPNFAGVAVVFLNGAAMRRRGVAVMG
jgi:hypothetical protein